MQIKRTINGEEIIITLTQDEISAAHDAHVTSFMQMTLQNDFDMEEKDAIEVAKDAYQYYCEGNGDTEYECIQKAYDDWCKEE